MNQGNITRNSQTPLQYRAICSPAVNQYKSLLPWTTHDIKRTLCKGTVCMTSAKGTDALQTDNPALNLNIILVIETIKEAQNRYIKILGITIRCIFDDMSRTMRKPTFSICENKDIDQLRGNHEADQRLCFRYIY